MVGILGRFVPEELIYATGVLPYLLCGGRTAEKAKQNRKKEVLTSKKSIKTCTMLS
jgi:hypothetical protein